MAQNIFAPNLKVSLVPEAPTPSIAPKVTTFIMQQNGGTATSGVLTVDIDPNSEDALFGANSMLATAIRQFRKINKVSRIDAIALDDSGTAVDSGGIIAFAGTATASGTIVAYIGNKERKYSVGVSIGDTATDIGAALVALIVADTKALASGVNTIGSVALTAVNGGTVGNEIGLLIEGEATGVTVVLTAFTGGLNDPVLTALPALLTERTDLVIPFTYSDLSLFTTFLDGRFNAENIPLDGRLFTAVTDTKAAIVAAVTSENSQSLVIFADKPVDKATKKGSAIFEMPYQKSSDFAGVRAIRLEDDQLITDFITTTASRDQIGGTHTSSLPYFNTATQLTVIPIGEGFSDFEVTDLNDAGASLMGNNRASNTLIIGQVHTTYKTNIQGIDDETYKFLNYVDTATAAREFILNALSIDYAQSRLTLGSAVTGHDIATKGGVRSDFLKYMETLASADFVLLQGGTLEDGRSISSIISDSLVVDFDTKNGIIQVATIMPIMTQVRTIIAPLNIRFDVTKAVN